MVDRFIEGRWGNAEGVWDREEEERTLGNTEANVESHRIETLTLPPFSFYPVRAHKPLVPPLSSTPLPFSFPFSSGLSYTPPFSITDVASHRGFTRAFLLFRDLKATGSSISDYPTRHWRPTKCHTVAAVRTVLPCRKHSAIQHIGRTAARPCATATAEHHITLLSFFFISFHTRNTHPRPSRVSTIFRRRTGSPRVRAPGQASPLPTPDPGRLCRSRRHPFRQRSTVSL